MASANSALPNHDLTVHQNYVESNCSQSHPSFTLAEVILEIKTLYTVAFPMIITGLLIYGKSMISMLFLGKLGKDALAGGSLAMGVANITGYSILSGLALGMDAISSQAFGANQWTLMSQTLQRTILIVLVACIPISLLWLNIHPILLSCHQENTISTLASIYLTYSLPDLLFQALINPLRIYLRSQNITLPLVIASALALALHAPVNYILVDHLQLGIKGVAIAASFTDLSLLSYLILYTCKYTKSLLIRCSVFSSVGHEWGTILRLALPSCFSVCLEWWWYEMMILLSGLLPNAVAAVATVGILIQAMSLAYIFPHALSSAASTRVGNELGAGQPRRAKMSSTVAMLCAVASSLVAMSCMVGLRGAWARTYTRDAAIVKMTAAVMPVVAVCELGNCPQTAGCGVLRGSARPGLGVRINLASFYGVGLPLAVFLGFGKGMGLLGLLLGLLGAQIVCSLVMIWMLITTDWAVEANRARELFIKVNIHKYHLLIN